MSIEIFRGIKLIHLKFIAYLATIINYLATIIKILFTIFSGIGDNVVPT